MYHCKETEDPMNTKTTSNGKSKASLKNKSPISVQTNDPALLTKKMSFQTLEKPKQIYAEAIIPIRGVTPLIIHRFSEKAMNAMREKQSGRAMPQKEPLDPEANFNAARYTDGKDDYMLAVAFKGAVAEAAKSMEGISGAEIKRSVIVYGNANNGEWVRIESDEPVMREDAVRVQTTCHLRHRPQYNNWRVQIRVRYNPRVITLEQLVYALTLAGSNIGVGELRPCSRDSLTGGTNGTFEIDFELAKNIEIRREAGKAI